MIFYIFILVILLSSPIVNAWEFNNKLSAEYSYFTQAPRYEQQHGSGASFAIEPELYTSWDDSDQSFTFKVFYRHDSENKQRTHADIREFSWLKIEDDWEMQLGVSSVFWGVTESHHLVDVINQSDTLENPDGSVKLGQAMLRLGLIQDWGTTNLFILPGFREREFANEQGRFRPDIAIDSNALYQSSRGDKHIDFALRWEHTIDDIDVGIAYFYGTDRDPSIKASMAGDAIKLQPFYDLIKQTSIDIQLTQDAWLWKLEALSKNRKNQASYFASVAGFEYTFYGVNESDVDLGILLEYQYNNADESLNVIGNNDIFTGLRLGFNDVDNSEFLLGAIVDAEHHGRVYSIKASRRISNSFKLSLEGRVFDNIPFIDPLNGLLNDDFIRMELAWFFSK